MSDEELVRRIREGDTALFEIMMRRYNTRLYRVARGILRDDAEAEDVMQQAYVNAFIHLDQFADRAKFSTWLTKIAVYEALARTRRAKRETSVADDLDAEGTFMDRLPSPDRTPEAAAYGQELGGLLESAVAALPEAFRSVFMLRDVEGMSTSGPPVSRDHEDTVKTRSSFARARQRRHLTAQIGVEAPGAFQFHATRCDRVVRHVMGASRRCAPARGLRLGPGRYPSVDRCDYW
jgi:RNA polymerase sigma-70 factor (ECF subfamily)